MASAQACIDPEWRKTRQKQAAGKESVCSIKNVHDSIRTKKASNYLVVGDVLKNVHDSIRTKKASNYLVVGDVF
jgi:hypothetical protein